MSRPDIAVYFREVLQERPQQEMSPVPLMDEVSRRLLKAQGERTLMQTIELEMFRLMGAGTLIWTQAGPIQLAISEMAP